MLRFSASAVSTVETTELNVFAVILAENVDGSGARLEIQRALSFDAQDRELGQDTYCLSTETGCSHYGGISVWRLLGDRLEIALDSDAAKSLGVTSGFIVDIVADLQARNALEAGMRRVLGELQ